MKIKQIIRRIPGYALGSRMKRYLLHKKEQTIFRLYGDEVMEKVHFVLKQSGKLFFVDAGALLGIYREGRLLKNDMDVDMCVNINDFSDIKKIRNLFTANGIQLSISYTTDKFGTIQDTFYLKGIRIDLCYYVSQGLHDIYHVLYGDDARIIKLIHTHVNKTVEFKYKKQIVLIPENRELYLIERYGDTWRIPDPIFKYWEGPNVTHEDGFGSYIFFNN